MSFLIGNFFLTIGLFASFVLQAYTYVVFAVVVISWLPIDRSHPAVRFIEGLVEPVLSWMRRRMPFLVQGGIDFSPWALLIVIQVVRSVTAGSLIDAAHRL